ATIAAGRNSWPTSCSSRTRSFASPTEARAATAPRSTTPAHSRIRSPGARFVRSVSCLYGARDSERTPPSERPLKGEAHVALGFYFTPAGFTPAKYDETLTRLEAAGAGAPPGRLSHVALQSSGPVPVCALRADPQ